MADKPDWFKMDPSKFMQDCIVETMSTLELGMTFRLLCRQWIDGFIPDDQATLARLCRVDRSVMGEAWPILCKFFPEIEPGKRANRFMWVDRETVLSAMKKREEDGRASVLKRWDAIRDQKEGCRLPIADLIQDIDTDKDTEEDKDTELQNTLPTASVACMEVVSIWNESTKDKLPKAKLNKKRESEIKARLKEPGWLEDFKSACSYLITQPWAMGQGERPWTATIDYLLRKGKATENAEKATAKPHGGTNGSRSPKHRAETDAAYIAHLGDRAAQSPSPSGGTDEDLSDLWEQASSGGN